MSDVYVEYKGKVFTRREYIKFSLKKARKKAKKRKEEIEKQRLKLELAERMGNT